ncbi:MAG: M20 family metallopeptidase [Planctomycetota bacterium]|nr:M20 family metallopeptidase [Planctomycetota bacterium]
MSRIQDMIQDLAPSITALRHEIHAHPELGFEENETARRVVAQLKPLGNLEIQTGVAKTGVVATLNRDKPGKCVALRAELDCLPIHEEGNLPYKSRIPGKMHACGHDGHMSCLVGAAHILSRMADELPGKVKFVFQPAEEGGAGARIMSEEGVLNNPNVDAIFALHGWPELELGTIGVRGGPTLASTNPWRMTIHGDGAHAAYPHKGIDPILAASHIVVALQSIASRSIDPLESIVVTVAEFHAGTADNIIPPAVELTGTIRTLNPDVRKKAVGLVQQIATTTAAAFGARAEVNITDGYPTLINNDEAAALVADVARDVLGDGGVADVVPPSMGGEDFAYYAQRIPAAFWRLGVRTGDPSEQPGLHHPTYDFPDVAIPYGIRMHCEIARQFLNGA